MMQLQGTKHVVAVGPISATAAGTITSTSIDTLGYDELQLVFTKTTHATDAIATLTIQHADSDSATNYGTITGYVVGTDYTAASLSGGTNAASEKAAAVFNFDLRGKKRFFRCLLVNGTATGILGVTGTLARGGAAPISATNINASVVVNPS